MNMSSIPPYSSRLYRSRNQVLFDSGASTSGVSQIDPSQVRMSEKTKEDLDRIVKRMNESAGPVQQPELQPFGGEGKCVLESKV